MELGADEQESVVEVWGGRSADRPGRRRLHRHQPDGSRQGARRGIGHWPACRARHHRHCRGARRPGGDPRTGQRAGLQDGGHPLAGRRPDRQDLLRGGPERQGGRSTVPDRPASLPGRARPGLCQPQERRGPARGRAARSRALRQAGAHRLPVQAELRPAEGDRRLAQGLDRRRQGADRQCQAQPLLCRYPRADRWPHRPAPGRSRQHGAGQPEHHAGHDYPDQADLRQLHRAAIRQPQSAQEPGEAAAHRHRLLGRRQLQAGPRRADPDRQPDRGPDRHAQAQGHLRQHRRTAVAGRVRQRAA